MVCDYMPADKAMAMSNMAPIGQVQLVHSAQAKALEGFVQYLTGFRGSGRPMSQPKMAIVKTNDYLLLLSQDVHVGSESGSCALRCWVSK